MALPVYDNVIFNVPELVLNNIYDEKNESITQLSELYSLLETTLNDIVDNIFRFSLQGNLSNQPYVNIGGKAINQYISERFLKKSFDFDIHIVNDNVNINNFWSSSTERN